MIRTITYILGCFIVICLLPLALAVEEEQGNVKIKSQLLKEREFAEIKWQKLQDNPHIEEKTLDSFRVLQKPQLLKVFKLSNKNLQKMSGFKESEIKKIGNLETTGIRKILNLDNSTISKILNLDDGHLKTLSLLDRARISELSSLPLEEMMSSLDNFRQYDSSFFLTRNIISAQKINKAEERFQIAKQNLAENKKDLERERQLIELAVENKDDEAVKEHSKVYLLIATEAIMNHLEKIKSKIQQSYNIDEDLALDLIKDINLKNSELEKIQYDIESSNSLPEIKELASKISSAWKRISLRSEFYVRVIVNNKLEENIIKSMLLENKLEKIISDLDEKGLNTTSIDTKITLMSNKILRSKNYLDISNRYYEEAKFTGVEADITGFIAKSKLSSDLAIDNLMEVYTIVKEIIKDIRQIYPSVDFDEESYVMLKNQAKSSLTVNIDGFLKESQQKILDKFIHSINSSDSSFEILLELDIEDQGLELRKEIKGTLSDFQKDIINHLIESLESSDGFVRINIRSGGLK